MVCHRHCFNISLFSDTVPTWKFPACNNAQSALNALGYNILLPKTHLYGTMYFFTSYGFLFKDLMVAMLSFGELESEPAAEKSESVEYYCASPLLLAKE